MPSRQRLPRVHSRSALQGSGRHSRILKMMKFHFTMQDEPGGQSLVSEQDLAWAGVGAIRTVASNAVATRASSKRRIMVTSRVSTCGYYRSRSGRPERTIHDPREDTT